MITLSSALTVLLAISSAFPFIKISNLAAKIALFVAVGSAGLWLSRQTYVFIKKNRLDALNVLVRSIYLLLRQLHPLLGWLILAAATIHAAYYVQSGLLFSSFRIQSGIAAWIVLGLLVIFGLRFQFSLKLKFFKKSIRVWHVLTALTFLIVFGLHLLHLG